MRWQNYITQFELSYYKNDVETEITDDDRFTDIELPSNNYRKAILFRNSVNADMFRLKVTAIEAGDYGCGRFGLLEGTHGCPCEDNNCDSEDVDVDNEAGIATSSSSSDDTDDLSIGGGGGADSIADGSDPSKMSTTKMIVLGVVGIVCFLGFLMCGIDVYRRFSNRGTGNYFDNLYYGYWDQDYYAADASGAGNEGYWGTDGGEAGAENW